MTLNDIFKTIKNKTVSENLTLNDRYRLSKMISVTPTPDEKPVLRTADNQVLYTADGKPIRTLQ